MGRFTIMSKISLEFDIDENLTQRKLERYFTALNDEIGTANNYFVIRSAAVRAAVSADWFTSTKVKYSGTDFSGVIDVSADMGELVGNDIKAAQALGQWIVDQATEYNDVSPN